MFFLTKTEKLWCFLVGDMWRHQVTTKCIKCRIFSTTFFCVSRGHDDGGAECNWFLPRSKDYHTKTSATHKLDYLYVMTGYAAAAMHWLHGSWVEVAMSKYDFFHSWIRRNRFKEKPRKMRFASQDIYCIRVATCILFVRSNDGQKQLSGVVILWNSVIIVV